MSITIKINGLSLCHRGSGGISRATLPDFCKTPPALNPVPYPNIAYSKDLTKGTLTVFADGGNSIGHSMSEFFVSTGDELGTGGGVTSGTFAKEATWLTSSMNVRIEGQRACRHTDKMLHNHGNTLNTAGFSNPPVGGGMDCQAMWAGVDAETKPIMDEPDHQKRNKMITEKYASMYQRNSDYEWAGLAGVVSRQAGCNMVEAKKARENMIGGGDHSLFERGLAKDGYDALGAANRSIFGNIYPNYRFYELYGWDGIERCGDFPGHRIPDKIKEAFKKIEGAKSKVGADKAKMLREASNKIAEYEQQDVVQNEVYTDSRYKNALDMNEKWSSGLRMPFGWISGAKRPQLPLSANCGDANSILFDGSISNPQDRVKFYNKLMDEWLKQRAANPSGWSQMYNDIIKWSQNSGTRFIRGGGSSGGGGAGSRW